VSVARLTTQLTPAENSQEEGMGDEDWQIIVYDMLKSTPTIPLDVLIKTATEVVKESKDEDTISRVVIFLQQTFLRSSSKELLTSWPDFYAFVKEVLPQGTDSEGTGWLLFNCWHITKKEILAGTEYDNSALTAIIKQ
jgi:hypothetical protein